MSTFIKLWSHGSRFWNFFIFNVS